MRDFEIVDKQAELDSKFLASAKFQRFKRELEQANGLKGDALEMRNALAEDEGEAEAYAKFLPNSELKGFPSCKKPTRTTSTFA